jgi:hypothetical protein
MDASRCRGAAARRRVARRHGYPQPGADPDGTGLDLRRTDIPAAAGAAEQHRVASCPSGGPRLQRVSPYFGWPGLTGEGQLVFGAAEDVPPAVDPVRPGASSWPGTKGRSSALVACRITAGPRRPLTQPGTEFRHRGGRDPPQSLPQSGKRTIMGSDTDKAAPRGSLPPVPGEIDARGRGESGCRLLSGSWPAILRARRTPRPRPGPGPRSAEGRAQRRSGPRHEVTDALGFSS